MVRPAGATVLLIAVLASLCSSAVVASTVGLRGVSKSPTGGLPVVLWHGMGDSCCASYSIGALKELIQRRLGVYVHSIATGDSPLEDVWSSYFGNVNDQVAKACEQLRGVPELAHGYNAVGFSQGGQFMRAVAERCQHLGPRMRTLITLGAQHQGVANIPGCSTVPGNLTAGSTPTPTARATGADPRVGRTACETMQALLGRGAYLPWVRDHLVQAQYFKDPTNRAQYLAANPFLPDINNEKGGKNPQYAVNLATLDALVLYRFEDDTTVVPRDSAWFGELDSEWNLVEMKNTPLYKEDWIGLRQLDTSGRLHLREAPGEHMQFTMEWFESEVMWPWLAGDAPADIAAASAQ